MALSRPWASPTTDANTLGPIDLAPAQPANQSMLYQAMRQLNLLIQQANQLLQVVQYLQGEQAMDVTQAELAAWQGSTNLSLLATTVRLGGGSSPPTLSWDGTEFVLNAPLKTQGYESADGSAGATYSPGGTLEVKNGLIISGSISSGATSGTITDTPDDSTPYVRFNNTGPGDTNGVWVPLFTAMETWEGTDTIATVGTITTGTWEGDVLSPEYGGTGLDTVGSDGEILGVVSGAPAWVDTDTITSLGTIASGTWEGNVVAVEYGGTGLDAVGSDGEILGVVSGAPAWVNTDTITSLGTVTGGTWHGNVVAVEYGGTGLDAVGSDGDILGVVSGAPAWVNTDTITSLGTVTGGTWHGNVVAVEYGGTGLDAVGSDGEILGVVSGAPAWVNTDTITSSITTLGTVTIGTWHATVIGTAYGGTGLASIGSANQLLGVNSGATGLEYKTLAGTTNQVIVTPGSGILTLSLPQSIATTSSPTFSYLTVTNNLYVGVIDAIAIVALYGIAVGVGQTPGYSTSAGGPTFLFGVLTAGTPIGEAPTTTGVIYGRSGNTAAWVAAEPAITAGTSSQYWRGDKTWQPISTFEPAITAGTTEQYWCGDKTWQPISTFEPAITAGTTEQYWRGDKTWQTLPAAGGIPDAPSPSLSYARSTGAWTNNPTFGGLEVTAGYIVFG